MGVILKSLVVNQLLMLCFSYFSCISVNKYSSVDAYRLWYNNPPFELGSLDGSTIRALLVVNDGSISPPFGFGFFKNGTTNSELYYLVVFLAKHVYEYSDNSFDIGTPLVVVWTANKDHPVRENASLDFTAKGGLELKDSDGTLVWSTQTYGHSVDRLNITPEGNLVLLDHKDTVIWQSFDYPTDTWLPNQNISFGKRLTSRNSSTNLGSGLYYLTVTPDGLDAFFNSDPPINYISIKYDDYFNDSSIKTFTNYSRLNLWNSSVAVFQYITLESTGHLNLYQYDFSLDSNSISSQNIFGDFSECIYPTTCGSYGICSSSNEQCRCPGGNSSYFTQLQEWEPRLGCRQVTPLSCEDKQLHTFLEIKHVGFYNMEPWPSITDIESCQKACLENCTCKAALFSRGRCSLQSHVYSLQYDVNHNSSTFIKVQVLPQVLPRRKKSSLVPILVPTIFVIVVILLLLACYYKMGINSKYKEDEEVDEVIGSLKKFCFQKLKYATRDFQVRLGRGGFGSVFEGDLDDGTKVAVKVLDSIGQGKKEFLAEVNTIGSTNHFNLVKLIGYCIEKSNRLLVYEHMCNGSLDKWIFRPEWAQKIGWEIRRKIIIGLAKGLEYLHMHCNPSIIHFDIKPQNILLDGNFNVKISDFGLAKLIDRDQSQVLTVLRGTPGYVAPELFKGTNISVKADVFSFGIVILETVFCRKNLDSQSDPLVEIVKEKAETDQLHDLLDGYTEDFQCHKEEATRMVKIALWCLQPHNRRPFISTILKVLEGALDFESIPEYDSITMSNTELHFEDDSGLSTPPVASLVSGPR